MKTIKRNQGSLGRRFVLGAWVGLVACIGLRSAFGNVPEWSLATRLYGDEKARRIGDLVTILIDEQSSASRSAQSEGGKSTSGGGSASVDHPFYTRDDGTGETQVPTRWTRAAMPGWQWQAGSQFSGGGEVRSEEDLTSTLTGRVMDVLPNGNLLIEGRRVIQLQEERVEVVLTGIARPRDISAANILPSSRIADATIRYETSGPLTREQRRGLLTRLLNWMNLF